MGEPALHGGDALLERGLAEFRLRVTVLSSQRQLQRFRIHVMGQSQHYGDLSLFTAPMRTLTKIRPKHGLRAVEPAEAEPLTTEAWSEPTAQVGTAQVGAELHQKSIGWTGDSDSQNCKRSHNAEQDEERELIWKAINQNREQLSVLQAQHAEIQEHLLSLRDHVLRRRTDAPAAAVCAAVSRSFSFVSSIMADSLADKAPGSC